MEAVLVIHSIYRWVVIVAVVAVVVAGFVRYRAEQGWGPGTDRPYAIAAMLFDIQIAIGIILWLGKQGWNLRPFLAYIHPVAMVIAVGVFHAAIGRARKDAQNRSHLIVGLGALVSLAIVLLAIPWAGVS